MQSFCDDLLRCSLEAVSSANIEMVDGIERTVSHQGEDPDILPVHLITESRQQTCVLFVLESALLIGRYNYGWGKFLRSTAQCHMKGALTLKAYKK